MAEEHWFDSLHKLLTRDTPRRGVLGAAVALTIGQWFGVTAATGKNGGNGGKNKRKRNGKGKKKKGGNSPPAPLPPPPGSPALSPPPPPLAPTCVDGMRNGGESDVDCGGTCPRCGNGLSCANRNDCASAFCVRGTCEECLTQPAQCGSDAFGACPCRRQVGGPTVCTSNRALGVNSCTDCPADTVCFDQQTTPESFACFPLCGAP